MIIKESALIIILLRLTTDGHKASRGLTATAELLVFIAHLVDRIVSAVRVSGSSQIITRFVGQLGSEIQVSVSFQSFALRMFACPVMFLPSHLPFPVPERSLFCPACPVLFYGDPKVAPFCRCVFSKDHTPYGG